MTPDDLSEPEYHLWDAFSRGWTVDLTGSPDNKIRASVLAALLLGAADARPGHIPAVRLKNAHITGRLDLLGAAVDYPFIVSDSVFDDRPRFVEATTRTIRIIRCRLPGLSLARMRLDGILNLSGSKISGPFTLDHAVIDGELRASGTTIGTDPSGRALTAEGLSVSGLACFNEGFSATGSVSFTHARFGGALSFKHATFTAENQWGALLIDMAQIEGVTSLRSTKITNPGRVALGAGGLTANGSIWMNGDFQATGEIRLVGATLRANIDLKDALLTDADLNLESATFANLNAPGLTVDGGQVRLTNAQVTSDVNLAGARLTGTNGDAVAANGLTAGAVNLTGAHATGRISLEGSTLNTFEARHLAVDHGRVLLTNAQVTGYVTLSHADITCDGSGRAFSAAGMSAGGVNLIGARLVGRVSVKGARVGGDVDLSQSDLTASSEGWSLICKSLTANGLRLDGAVSRGRITLRDAQITGTVEITNARLTDGLLGAVLVGDGLTAGMFDLSGSRLEGAVRLESAKISGEVRLRGATLDAGPDPWALYAEDLTAGSMSLQDLSSTGELSMRRAQVTAEVGLTGARLTATTGNCLSAAGLSARGLGLSRLKAQGRVSLRDANISDGVRMLDAELVAGPDGEALIAFGLSARRLVFKRLEASGFINLRGVQVIEEIDFSHARLRNPEAPVLTGDGLSADTLLLDDAVIEGGVALRGVRIVDRISGIRTRFSRPGDVALRLSLADVIGDVFLYDAVFEGSLRVTQARIGRYLQLDNVVMHSSRRPAIEAKGLQAGQLRLTPREVSGTIELQHARLGILHDEPSSWPEDVQMNGLTYDALIPALPPEERLKWLKRDSEGFQPQPYEQLAALYTRLGQQRHAQDVLLAKERHQRTTLPQMGRFWGRLQDDTVGYGYQPLRAAIWLALLLGIGTFVFDHWEPEPLKPGEHPQFNPFIFTLDLLLPIVDLGQERAFNPVNQFQWFAYALVATGWILATTIAAGAARTIRR